MIVMTANTSGRSDLCQFHHIHRSSPTQTTSCQLVFPSSGRASVGKETPWNAQLSDEGATVIGYALPLVTGRAPSDGSVWGQGIDASHVVRGGSWGAFPGNLRSARRRASSGPIPRSYMWAAAQLVGILPR